MPKRIPRYREKPWVQDPDVQKRWQKILPKPKTKQGKEIKPKGGWQLWDWRTLEDVPQK